MKALLILTGLCAATSPALDATQIFYAMSFTTTLGLAPTSGTFTYDAAAALGSQFTAFTVHWDGFLVDFTAAANTGPGVAGTTFGSTQDSANSFTLLTGGLCSPTQSMDWTASESGVTATFTLIAQGNGGAGDARTLQAQATGGSSGLADSRGHFTVSAVPEPSTFVLTLAAGAFLIGRLRAKSSRKRAAQGAARETPSLGCSSTGTADPRL